MPAATLGLDAVRAIVAGTDPDRTLVPCGLQDLVVGSDVIGRVPDVVDALLPAGLTHPARVVLLVDRTPIVRPVAGGEQDVKARVQADLAGRHEVRRAVLDDGHPELHVTEDVVAEAVRHCEDADVVVALGGGTISDIGKLATAGSAIRLLCVMTAASVDGYTDNVSVTLKDGVKRTVPSRWPDVVLADAETVAGAPAAMNRAGYGEMTSMHVAPADWRLAALVGVDPTFHPGPLAVLEALGDGLDACAPGVAAADPEAVQQLTTALALRGIATGVAGTTACLSGVEHLVSHMLDLRAAELHLPTGLHGAQVGAGSVVAACAWEMLHERLAADPAARPHRQLLEPAAARARVGAAFDGLDPSGRIAGECWRDYERKLDRVGAAWQTLDAVVGEWARHAPALAALVRPSRVIAAGLRASGTPALLTELGPDVDAVTARWGVEGCALMRDRFTVVDLLTLLGWWTEADVDELMERVAAAVPTEVAA